MQFLSNKKGFSLHKFKCIFDLCEVHTFIQTCSQCSISPEAASSSKLCFKHLKTWQRGEKYDHDLNLELCFIRRPSYPTDIFFTKLLLRMILYVLHVNAKRFYILTLWNIGYVMKYKIIRARHSRVSNKLSRLETLSS